MEVWKWHAVWAVHSSEEIQIHDSTECVNQCTIIKEEYAVTLLIVVVSFVFRLQRRWTVDFFIRHGKMYTNSTP